jgi:hypothetical protein
VEIIDDGGHGVQAGVVDWEQMWSGLFTKGSIQRTQLPSVASQPWKRLLLRLSLKPSERAFGFDALPDASADPRMDRDEIAPFRPLRRRLAVTALWAGRSRGADESLTGASQIVYLLVNGEERQIGNLAECSDTATSVTPLLKCTFVPHKGRPRILCQP